MFSFVCLSASNLPFREAHVRDAARRAALRVVRAAAENPEVGGFVAEALFAKRKLRGLLVREALLSPPTLKQMALEAQAEGSSEAAPSTQGPGGRFQSSVLDTARRLADLPAASASAGQWRPAAVLAFLSVSLLRARANPKASSV